jgi:energy-coupling factor transporter ATP-binding protein EcfA2
VVTLEELVLEPGETCVVVGPNGAGKSTLLRCLALLVPPCSGTLALQGSPLAAAHIPSLRRQVTLLHQRPVVFATDVQSNIAFGLRARGLKRQVAQARVTQALERVGLLALARRPAKQLSGGETQRLVIARAFALETPLLLLDEPFSYLDSQARPLLRGLLAEHTARGGAVIVATHDWEATGLQAQVQVNLGRDSEVG